MANKQFTKPSLLLFLPDGRIPPEKRLYLVTADDRFPVGRPVPKPRPGWVGDLLPIAEVFPTTDGPLRAYGREEFCRMVGISLRTFSRLVNSRRLKARKIDGRTVVSFEDGIVFLRTLPEAKGGPDSESEAALDPLLVSPPTPYDEVG